MKGKGDTSKVIVTDHNTALINSIAKVFSNSYRLLCRYHIKKNTRSQVKPMVRTKQIKGEDIKMVKTDVIVERIMNAWNTIINYSKKELYINAVIHFRKVCEKYPDLLKYDESTILDQVKEKIVYAWTDQVRHLGNTITNRVECSHDILKNWLENSKGDLCRD